MNVLSRSALSLLGLLVLIPWLFSTALMADESPPPTSLWHIVPAPVLPEQLPSTKKPWITREQYIAFDAQLLHVLKDAGARPIPPIVVDLFEKIHAEVEIMSTVSRINGTAVIRGRLKSPAQGDFTLAVNGSVVVATFQIGARLFKIEHVVNGHQRLIEVDPAKLPPD